MMLTTLKELFHSIHLTYTTNMTNEIVLSGNYFSRVDNSISGGSYKIFTNEISNTGGKESASKFTFHLLQDLGAKTGGKLFYTVDKTKKTSIF
jgi:hypothetical protein